VENVSELQIDELDRQILSVLQEDASLSNRAVAARVHLSPAPCLRRIQRLQSLGYIRRYVALVDRERVGLRVRALAFVTLESHHSGQAKQFESVIQKRPEVLECIRLSGAHDYLLKVVSSSMQAYSEFLDRHLLSLTAVRSVNSSFELGVLKDTTALPLGVAESRRTRRR
jgi:DNA-binding Lrp family transcriptional regulator